MMFPNYVKEEKYAGKIVKNILCCKKEILPVEEGFFTLAVKPFHVIKM